MKVQILGPGCAKCKQLYAAAEQAVQDGGLSVELEKVEDVQQMAAMGVITTPALAVNGKIKSAGRVLTPNEIGELLAKAES